MTDLTTLLTTGQFLNLRVCLAGEYALAIGTSARDPAGEPRWMTMHEIRTDAEGLRGVVDVISAFLASETEMESQIPYPVAYEAARPTEPDPATLERMARAYVHDLVPDEDIAGLLIPPVAGHMLAAWRAEHGAADG